MERRRRHLMKGSTVKITFLVCFSSSFFFMLNARGSVEFKLSFYTFFTLHFLFKSSAFYKISRRGKMKIFKDFLKAFWLSCVENCIQIDGRYFLELWYVGFDKMLYFKLSRVCQFEMSCFVSQFWNQTAILEIYTKYSQIEI